jgi:hypothetical protein
MIKSTFVGLDSRRNRRAVARENKVDFVPQYNGNAPYYKLSRAVEKIFKNNLRYEIKKAQREGADK